MCLLDRWHAVRRPRLWQVEKASLYKVNALWLLYMLYFLIPHFFNYLFDIGNLDFEIYHIYIVVTLGKKKGLRRA